MSSLQYGPKTQSASHGFGAHICPTECWSEQGSPPPCGRTFTERPLVLVPPPQSALHPVHSPHDDMTQSTGQGCCSQRRSVLSTGQAIPILPGCAIILRVSRCVPPPHVTEHGSGIQSETSQSLISGAEELPAAVNISVRICRKPHMWLLYSPLLCQHWRRCLRKPRNNPRIDLRLRPISSSREARLSLFVATCVSSSLACKTSALACRA